jgi:hypothetical protein
MPRLSFFVQRISGAWSLLYVCKKEKVLLAGKRRPFRREKFLFLSLSPQV